MDTTWGTALADDQRVRWLTCAGRFHGYLLVPIALKSAFYSFQILVHKMTQQIFL